MNPEQIRQTLLKSAREAGERYLHVRGVDLESALTGTSPERPTTKPAAKTVETKKDN